MEALLAMGAPIAALFTHEDDPHERIWWRSCAELACEHGIVTYAPKRVDQSWIEYVAALKPAVIYSFYYRHLIPESVLALAPRGAFNLHGSLLPKYRGRAPVNWMLVKGEREAGVTLHHMVARADAGDIVGQRAVAIDDDDTALTLYRKLVPLGVELVNEYHPLIAAGRAPRRSQNMDEASYFGRRGPEDGRIDWHWPARRVFNLVRAVTHPYPGAFVNVDGRKLFIWKARVASESGQRGVPGTIIGVGADGVEVAAGEGSISLVAVQFDGDTEDTPHKVLGAAARVGARI
jgi:methionyl-tRNA formyltransferase